MKLLTEVHHRVEMKIIGLTGGIGAGKTSVLNLFEKRNINCFNSDLVAKRLLDNDLRDKIQSFSITINP